MKKQSFIERLTYYLVGIFQFIVYYLLMTEFFKVNPFKGYFIILTIYLLISLILFPMAGKRLSEAIENKAVDRIFMNKSKMLVAYIFAPFILIFIKE
ncbi:MAG: hypothetical protein SOW41_02565 [Anaerococcus sp.]|nr:hypothetical protein [Peptoniphilaceae bacterium]MDY3054928.1 hypothetical protein [Anaerococcus sp.]